MRPTHAAAYESRGAITRSGGTRRAGTATRQARRPTSASEFSRATTIWSSPTPRSGIPTGLSSSRQRPTAPSATTSLWATHRSSNPTACRRAAASTSGISPIQARATALPTICVLLPLTRPARPSVPGPFPANPEADDRADHGWPSTSGACGGDAGIGLSRCARAIGCPQRGPGSARPRGARRAAIAVRDRRRQDQNCFAPFADVTRLYQRRPVGAERAPHSAPTHGPAYLCRVVQYVPG